MSLRILVTGGGTGGHIYPALAILKGVKNRYPGSEVLYVGTKVGLEADIVPKAGIPFATVTVEGLQRKFSLQTFAFGIKLARGLVEARRIINDFRPDVVVGTGGYVCGPVVYVAAQMGIPTLIHEQNAYPGITNKLLSRVVNHVAVTFSDSIPYFTRTKAITHTGLPVREEILATDRQQGIRALSLDPGKKLVLVTGGSRGARSINQAMPKVLAALSTRADVQVVHITGQLDYEEARERIRAVGIDTDSAGNITIVPYLYNMADAMAAADMIICRAGATTLAEVTARGIPAILIPYPYASENHQEHNAKSLVNGGAAVMILDRALQGELLKDQVLELLDNSGRLATMHEKSLELGRPRALEDILNILEALVTNPV